MAIYEFKTDDGETVLRQFPIGTCPRTVTTDDGREARRVFGCNVSLFSAGGHLSGDGASRIGAEMRRRQSEAGKRMRERWKPC